MEITGRTILITGATSGIGRGLAERFQAEGNTVVVGGRRKELLDEIVEANPGMAAVELDVTDQASAQAAFDDVTTRFPEVDVLVNNAGVGLLEDLRAGDGVSAAEQTLAVNVLGTVRMTALFVPYFLERGRGSVVNTSSGLAFVPLPPMPTYGASKAAVHSLTQSLRVQLAGTGLDVVEVLPPAVRTTFGGQQEDERAVPLEDFLDELMTILREQPDVEEALIESVRPLRYAEVNGNHRELLTALGEWRPV